MQLMIWMPDIIKPLFFSQQIANLTDQCRQIPERRSVVTVI